MKRIYFYITATLLVIVAFGCKKNDLPVIATNLSGTEAQIKFFNFGVNGPGVNFYGNDNKISAILSVSGTESTTGTVYSSVFPSVNYSIVTPGSYKFTAVTPALATTNPGVTVATVNSNLESGKFYSLYTCGLYDTNAKTTDVFVLNDVLPPVDQSGYVRFVNTISNASAGLSLYAKNTTTGLETLIGTSIAYKSGSNFVALDAGIYEFYARYASAPTVNVISRNGTSVITILGGKAYTVSSRGDATVSATGTATNRPFLDQTPNR